MENVLNIQVNTEKIFLSSETKLFKTESFSYQTKKISKIDFFISSIAQNFISRIDDLKKYLNNASQNCYRIETIDKTFIFYFVIGSSISDQQKVNDRDIVFIGCELGDEKIKSNDQRVVTFLSKIKIFNVNIFPCYYNFNQNDLSKLYNILSSEFVNLPLLSDVQEKIVEIENKNVLVQGVAGSGKTNICISKIIFTACKLYSGKILYTTFSRGLLIDTRNKIELFKNTITNFINQYKNNKIVFLDKNHKKAVEIYLGLSLTTSNDENLILTLEKVVDFLNSHIDYYLIEDLYKLLTSEFTICTEDDFTNNFLPNLSNHQLFGRMSKISHLSPSILYKEIYGMIFGYYSNNSQMLEFEEYKKLRQGSFNKEECEIIYSLAKEFLKFKKTQNLTDNNEISNQIIQNIEKFKKYSLSILDEVQDFTRVNLILFKNLSLKLFAVGDALQMINPTYFNFAFLKNLLYVEDVTDVVELKNNYRNNKKIVELLDKLSEINKNQFGTHSFVLSALSVDGGTQTTTIYTNDKSFIDMVASQKFEDFTILVNDKNQKDALRKKIKKQEILTISEVKGLERDTVLLYNVLSSNSQKWKDLELNKINHKTADENSVYRYYFNLFYVGISRAKHNIFIFEEDKIYLFENFFKTEFENLDGKLAFQKFKNIVSSFEIDDEEILERIDEFIKLGQFDNAKFYVGKLSDESLAMVQNEKVDIYKFYVFKNKNREAGIKLWQIGLVQESKKQFVISGDLALIEFMESLETKNQSNLDAGIVKFFLDFDDNKSAQELILEVLKSDIDNMKNIHTENKKHLKMFKENKYAK